MTRLEESEETAKQLGRHLALIEVGAAESILIGEMDIAALLFALDCYRARVAVLEEALENYANKRNWANKTFSYQDPWLDAEETLALTPEECLERQSRTHKDSLLVGEEE